MKYEIILISLALAFCQRPDCTDGEYEMGGRCRACSTANCKTCPDDQCSACLNPNSWDATTSTCVDPCPNGKYDLDGVCTTCSKTDCKTCPGDACSACTNSKSWDATTNACVAPCPDGKYDLNGACTSCSASGCKTCPSNTCTACLSSKYLEGTQCLDSCPSGKYGVDGVCKVKIETGSSSKLSGGAIAGIVIGATTGFGILSVGLYCYFKKYLNSKAKPSNPVVSKSNAIPNSTQSASHLVTEQKVSENRL